MSVEEPSARKRKSETDERMDTLNRETRQRTFTNYESSSRRDGYDQSSSSTNQVRQDDSRLDGHDLSEAVERPAGVGVVGIAESVEEVGQDVVEGALADGRVQLVKSLRGGLANFR